MDCAGIQELLSEYIDGTLDAKSVQVVEKHLSACADCKETFASLNAMVEELNALEPVKAPADFLENIHRRMDPRSDVSRLFKKLFVPFKIKIPLQLAAAATASILVVMVLNLQKSEYQKMEPLKASKSEWFAEKPKTDHLTSEVKTKRKHPAPIFEEAPERVSDSEQDMETPRSKVKTPVQPSIQRESEPSSSVLATARPTAEKDQPIALALVVKPVATGRAYSPDMVMQNMPLAKGDKKTFGRTSEIKQQYPAGNLLTRMNHIIGPLKGNILTKEFHKQNDRLKSVHVQIPAENYTFFCREIKRLATFKTPPPALSDESLETVKLLINLTYPE